MKEQVKFCVFADLHYMPGHFPNDTPEWLGAILRRAEEEHVDFIIHAGDFTHGPVREPEFVKAYNDFHIKTYHAIGNHDDDGNSHEETLRAYGLSCGYYHFDCNGFRFIVLDDNYYKEDEQYIHFSLANYYKSASTHWIPPAEVAWFRETVNSSPYPCVTICHGSFDREAESIHNYQEMRDIVNAANQAHPGKVRLCINGHHHRDHLRIMDDVVYFDLNSANYAWLPVKHACYSEDVLKRWRMAEHTLFWDAPLSAIVTLTGDGTIDIKGSETTMHQGVTRDMTGNAHFDANGRSTTSKIQSAHFTMHYGC